MAESIGRLGCHFYGCCFGRPISKDMKFISSLGVMYIHNNSSVSRLHPEYLLQPLIPTQIGQSLFALLSFIFTLKTINYNLSIGSWFCIFIYLYNIDRIIFYYFRDDESYKKKKSYTTLYISIATLLIIKIISIYILIFPNYPEKPYIILSSNINKFELINFGIIGLILALINLFVQGLHNPLKIGQFFWCK